MAFFPLQTIQFSNYDLKRSSTFKSGMVLMRSTSSEVIKADRSLAGYDNVNEQLSKFIGFASIDHDTNNSIILSDSAGSSYVDTDGEYYENINTHYRSLKRSILELSDESINKYYNLSDTSNSSPRGTGVYNISGETYITDQFNNVLAFTTFADDTNTTILSPGDLLTFGAGINAGKLVKVDVSGFGPNVVVVGIVEKHDTAANLLYFRHHLSTYRNTPTLYSTGLAMSLDANNLSSYDAGVGGTVWNDLSGNGLNAYLVNGPTWNTAGYFSLDGANDFIYVPDNDLLDFPADFSVESFYKATGHSLHAMISKRYMNAGGTGVWSFASFFGLYNLYEQRQEFQT